LPMASIRVSSWIPRSYTHIYEIAGKLNKVLLPIEDVRVDKSLEFKLETQAGRRVECSLTPYGLFSFTAQFSEDEIAGGAAERFKKEISDLLLERIFKDIQKVTYQQIKDGIMPLFFHAVVFSEKHAPKELEPIAAGGIRLYFDRQNLYSAESILYVCGKSASGASGATDYFSYLTLASAYVNAMVEAMSGVYAKIVEVEQFLQKNEFNKINARLASIAKIRKDSSETYGKIKQAVSNFSHASDSFRSGKLTKEQSKVASALALEDGFERLKYDSNYLLPLWSDVLIKNLENLNLMIDERFEFQQSTDTKVEQREMKLLQAIFLVGVIASMLTLGAMPGAKINLYTPDGVLAATGSIASFKLEDFLLFGFTALSVSLLLFLLFNFMYIKLTRLSKKISEKIDTL